MGSGHGLAAAAGLAEASAIVRFTASEVRRFTPSQSTPKSRAHRRGAPHPRREAPNSESGALVVLLRSGL